MRPVWAIRARAGDETAPRRRPRPRSGTIALNTARIGHRYPAYTYEVSRQKVREYAFATGMRDPAYIADARDVPDADLPVPATFPACFTLMGDGAVMDDPELGAHWNLVHGGQEFTYHRPLSVGDVLECQPWIVDVKSRRGMELLTIQVDCADPGGVPVLESRGVLIFFDEESG